MNLVQEFQDQLSPELINFLSRSIGNEDKQATQTAATSIFSVLLNAVGNNVQSQGSDGLMSALTKDHDGSIFDSAVEFLSGQKAPANPKMLNSPGILSHLLGQRQGNVVQSISKISGLDPMDIGELLLKITPLAMGVLGKAQRNQSLNSNNILDSILNSNNALKQNNPKASIFAQILDQDGDGSYMDDLANIGLKNLSRFFRG